MKILRYGLALGVLMLLGAVAEAQCLKCYRVSPGWNGVCGESFDDYCDRQCCGSYEGAPCSIPDFIDPCDPWRRASSTSTSLLATKAKAAPPTMWFTTTRPVEKRQEAIHRRLQALDPAAPRCGKA